MNAEDLLTKRDLYEFEQRLYSRLGDSGHQKKLPKYLRTKDVIEMFSLSSSTIQNLRISGKLPYQKIGGSIIYDREEVESALINSPGKIKRNSSKS